MGVRGLTTFIDSNPHLLESHQLQNTKLVIDGSNLYFHIYFNMNLRCRFGGDYDLFALRTRQVFNVFLDCNIEPYVVFDGAYDRDDKKLQTTLVRAKKRILSSDAVSRGRNGRNLPYLVYDTFVSVLKEMNIVHVTCDREADDQIAVLANKLGCPVLSLDSDFYIFDLVGGFIPTDYVEFKAKDSSSGKYMYCVRYDIDRLVEAFEGLTKSNLPLAAAILGNDYIEEEGLKPFFATLKMPKADAKKTVKNRGYHQLLTLLHWLASLDEPDTAPEQIVRYVPPKTRDKLLEILKYSIDSYRKISLDFDLVRFVQLPAQAVELTQLKGYNGSDLPDWLMFKVRRTELPVFVLNTITLHRNILLSQIEHTQSPSANACATRIRRVLYGILLKDDLELGASSGRPDRRRLQVEEYDREIKDCKKSYIEPLRCLEGFGDLPCLKELRTLRKGSCELLLRSTLLVEDVDLERVPSYLRLYISTIIYWIKKSNPAVTRHHWESLLVCMFYLHLKQRKKSPPPETELVNSDLNLESVCRWSDTRQLNLFDHNMSKFCRAPSLNHKSPFDISVIHGFAQFQSCLYFAKHLNKVIGLPFEDVDLAKLYNGTFVYNLCKDLTERPRPDLYLSEMLVKGSPFCQCLEQFEILILTSIPPEAFQGSTGPTRTPKRHKHRQSERPARTYSPDQSNERDPNVVPLRAACALSNKFEMLSASEG